MKKKTIFVICRLSRIYQIKWWAMPTLPAESDNPPSNIVILLSKALNVSADELLGLNPASNHAQGQASLKITRRMKKIEELPAVEQKFILKAIDSHLKALEK